MTGRIDHVDAVVQRLLGKAPDAGIDGPRGVALDAACKAAVGRPYARQTQVSAGHLVAGQLGQDVGRVHHHVLHHLTHAGLDLGSEHPQDEKRRNAIDDKEGEKETQA
ncbi:hypothetical protein SDC9_88587 [bioreactor metagenome]|uniref:Uncharacterized protein n=1 Tax=bioreactor metagenome TaxID=1076179 RepID=A0A644ZMH1_9ZZZZ